MAGCQTVPYAGKARIVKMKPQQDGVIALPLDPRSEDRALAESKMEMNCKPGKYKVLEEGEVVIGQATNTTGSTTDRASSKQKVGSLFGIPITSGTGPGTDQSSQQVTSQIKEWQISYKCLAANTKK